MRSSAMHRITKYIASYKWRYAVGGVCLFATASLVMTIPMLTQRAVDAIRVEETARENLSLVATYALLIILVAVSQSVVRTFSRVLIFNAGRDVEHDLRNELFSHLSSLPQSYYQTQRTGDLMSRLINDIAAVRLMLGPGILTFISTPLYCVYAFSLMFYMAPALTLAAIVPFPILLWVVKHYSHRMMESVMRTQEKLGEISSFVQENLSGIQVVKAYVREDERKREFAVLNEDFKHQSMEVAKLRGKIFPFIRIVSSLGVLIVLYYGGLSVIRGTLTLGQLVAFIGYLHILAWPIMALGWMISIYQRGKAAMIRLGEILDTVPAIRNPPDPMTITKISGEIRFDGVNFGYAGHGNGHGVLSDIDLTIPAGSRVGIIGRTGSGKSTLVSLISRLHDVGAGCVSVDGVDVRQWDLARLRDAVGFVPQDPFLFSRSIEDNISFGMDALVPDEMTRLVEMAALDSDLAEFPEGLDTQVGERGLTMSGGQKQRITLARAIAGNPKILILDDSLSSVDAATESRILGELDDVMRDRTTLIISHRVSAVQNTDMIAVLDEGRIVETGTHSELINAGGLYAELFQRQRLAEELEAM